MMIKLSLIISCIFLTLSLTGQNNDTTCYVLRVANNKYLSDTSLLQPRLYRQGFHVLTNGVYDFVINGEIFNHQRVLEITRDSIFTAYAFDTVASLKFSINDEICIRLNTRSDGRVGMPAYTRVTSKKYQFKIIKGKYSFFKNVEVCSTPECDIIYPGYQYFAGTGLQTLYRNNGVDIIVAGSTPYEIRKP